MATAVALVSCAHPGWQSLPNADNISAARSDTMAYGSLLAARLGAHAYGMKRYVMALLKAGDKRDQDSIAVAGVQEAYLKNIIRLASEGKLVLAGPFLDNGEVRGIYVFNVETLEEAGGLTDSDPAVQAGHLRMDLHPW